MRILQWTVAILVLCNIGLMVTIWFRPHYDGPPRGEQPRDFVIRSLKFSDDQVKKYDALIKVHRHAMDELNRQGVDYRQLLFSNLKNDQANVNTDSMAQLIANNQKQVELATYHHFAQLRAICDNSQKETFDKIINDVMKKMHGGMRGGPPPRERDDHHPGDEQGPPPGPAQNP